MTHAPEQHGLLFTDDLMWASRVTGTAQALSFVVRSARTLERLEALARERAPHCVIIDLAAGADVARRIVERLRAVCPEARFTAFGSHVDTATLQAARAAGCDPVLPRSRFAEELPVLLQEWLGG
jgi:ActR/RegA family two-component response regulator